MNNMSNLLANKLINKRLGTVLLLGFTSGLPFALTGSTLQAWFTEAQVNLMAIGTLSLIGLPYILKFLWAPILDHFTIPLLGKRKGWIVLTQLGTAVMLLIMAQLNPSQTAMMIGLAALMVAFFSASQDVSITAYQTEILHLKERGLGASYYVFGYRIAVLVSGGLALIFADYLGFKLMYQLMALLMMISMAVTFFSPAPREYKSKANLLQTTMSAINEFLSRDKILLLMLFILFYKLGDALALQLMTNFLLKGLGFSLTEIGIAYKTISFVAIILGGFVGGLLLLRWEVYWALLLFGLMQAFSNLTFALLAYVGKDFSLMMTSIFIENFCSGLSTAALFAFLMALCDQRYTATQFALFSAVASLSRVFLGPLASMMVTNYGWIDFYIWTFILCFPGIFFLVLLKNKVYDYASAAID